MKIIKEELIFSLTVNLSRTRNRGFIVQARTSTPTFDRNSSLWGTFLLPATSDSAIFQKILGCKRSESADEIYYEVLIIY